MQTTTAQLKEAYPQIIDRLDKLYGLGLNHPLSASEQAEIDELRYRALMIHTELAQRERYPAGQTA